MKKIEIKVERTDTGYCGYAIKYPVYTVGGNFIELRAMMIEALNQYFENETLTEADLKITLDLPQFFEFYKVINAKALGERIGMSQSLLAQYITGKKKPSVAQTKRILAGIQQVGKELAEMQFLL